ncbi:MAG: M28 family metallopeptidase [Terracidiphilus sp.]
MPPFSALVRCFSIRACQLLTPCLLIGMVQSTAAAQQVSHPGRDVRDYQVAGSRITSAPADKRITAALKQVSTERIRADISALVNYVNRSTVSSTETDLPAGTGVLAASDWIKEQLESYSKACGNCLEVKVDAFVEQPPTGAAAARARITKPTPIRNVYAILRGSDPAQSKRMYLVTGHYDSRETDVMETHMPAPGANDDLSGVAVSLESARILSQYKFPATIVFVCVAGEEQGLNGSRHLARLARDEGWQLEGVLNNDIVGGDTTPGETLQNKSLVRVFSQGILPSAPPELIAQQLSLGMDNDTPSRELAREILAADRTYFASAGPAAASAPWKPFEPVMEMRLDRYLRGGDHSSFSAEGFPAVRFTEWRENFNHQHQHVRTEGGIEYGDLLKFDDFQYIAQVARLNMATLATLASSPGVPQNVRIVTTNLDNNTTLKWDPPAAGSDSIQYQIVWRETAASDWQFSTDAAKYGAKAGNNSVTLPVSKDNVFFGVRACDAAGHCSQAVAPVPERR